MAIDIGSPAINRAAYAYAGYTWINENNPASEAGTIGKVELYMSAEVANVEVAIFHKVDGNTFTTRSNVTLGTVPAGYSEHAVSLAMEVGDYIGLYYPNGGVSAGVDRDSVGAGFWRYNGDAIPCTNLAFNHYATYTISICGSLAAPAGFPHSQGIIIG